MQLLEKSLTTDNMLIRVFKKCRIFLNQFLYFESKCHVEKYTRVRAHACTSPQDTHFHNVKIDFKKIRHFFKNSY